MGTFAQLGTWSSPYRVPAHWGMGDTTQQGDAATLARSLQQSAALATAVGGPIAGGIVEAAAALANIVSLFGPNPNNTITTGWVNQIEADVMKPNLAAWQALPANQKTLANQQAALQVFTIAWNRIVQLCSNAQLGSAGTNCIADRQRGGKWDWWSYYYDPIAKDQVVAQNIANDNNLAPSTSSTGGTQTGGGPSSTTGSSQTSLWIGLSLVGLAAALFMFGGGD